MQQQIRCNISLQFLQIDQFIEHIQTQVVNDKIFPNIVSGFMDTNPVVRESTIKVNITFFPMVHQKKKEHFNICHFIDEFRQFIFTLNAKPPQPITFRGLTIVITAGFIPLSLTFDHCFAGK